jgi:teichuronic acid biosynthesis glycosyltransferase TuaG
MSDLISIIIPSYNSESYLEACINSVLNQTYNNWEMLIVDDGSTDSSRQIIQHFANSENRIKPLYLDSNIGAAAARNLALENSSASYIAFLDSDDLWLPTKLDVQLRFMQENNYDFTFSSYNIVSEHGKKIISKIIAPKKISYNQYLKNTIIGCLTVMINKDKFKSVKMPCLRSSHDMALWLNLLRDGRYAYGLNHCLANYRLVKTSNTSNKFKAIYDVWLVYRKHEGFSFLYSLYNWVFYIFNALKKRI